MKTIIAIIGASGSGKTQLSLYASHFGYPVICSYTTRPMRESETNGVEHIFVTEDQMPSKDKMLAYTFFGGYHYWAEKAQVDDNIPTLYVIDEKGLVDLKSKYKDEYKIFCVYVTRPNNDVDKERQERDNDRIKIDPSDIDMEIVNDYNSLKEFLEIEGQRLVMKLDIDF